MYINTNKSKYGDGKIPNGYANKYAGKNIVRHFAGLHDLCDYFDKVGARRGRAWSGDYDNTLKLTREGDLSMVPEAEKLIEKLDATVESVGPIWQGSVYGPILSVPDYLSNTPTPFRRNVQVVSDVSPVKIWIGIVCSASVSKDEMMRRGVAIMALVMMLQRVRPVEISLFHETEGGYDKDVIYEIPLESKPVSIAHCMNALANVYVARDLTYDIARKDGFEGGWPHGYNGGYPAQATPQYAAYRADVLGITEQDILIDSTFMNAEILRDPIAWINKNLSLYTIPQED